ncbi:inhibitor of growth protein [Anaeramoeba flamelloides]|uniref:Inhibitor of growth protein n=1 Tax=Anaeramoeba flamelloides TaxID=1746091 RepID=A0AAV7YBG4_9EUKA|nr:inhibitor of growth protein [Anaeramoeba flamelloides]
MNDYWSIEQLQAEDQNVQFKPLCDMKYIGFLTKEPLEEELVFEPEGVVHPLKEISNDNEEESSSEEEDDDENNYCCGRELDEDWIQCDYPKCTKRWYHFSCAGITTLPIGKWYCKSCVKIIEEQIKIYEEKIITKKIKSIKKSQVTELPLWLAIQFKSLKLSVFKMPFRYSETFLNRCLEDYDFQENFANKSRFWYYSGAVLAGAARDPQISNDFSQIFVQRLNHLLMNTKTFKKEFLLFTRHEKNILSNKNNNRGDDEDDGDLLIKPQQPIKSTLNNLLISKIIKENNINLNNTFIGRDREDENKVKGNGKGIKKEKEKKIINSQQETILDQQNKRKIDELFSNQPTLKTNKKTYNQTNDSNIIEQMKLKKRRQIQQSLTNDKNNDNKLDNFMNKQINNEKLSIKNLDNDLNSITKLLKQKLIVKKKRIFENFILWNNSQQEKENLMQSLEKKLQIPKEEKKIFKKLTQLEKNIYLYWGTNSNKFNNWVLKFQKK